jgi:polar amino acid transport system substrate-binding protein
MNPILKLKSIAIAALMLIIGTSAAIAQESTYDVVKKRGTLIAGLRKDFPPAAYINQQGEWVGYEVDLMEYIAAKLGVKLQRVEVNSRTRIPLLVNGNVDVAMAVMNPTRERAQVIDFTQPYFLGGQALLVRKDSGVKGIADMAGKKVGTTQGSQDPLGVLAFQPKAEIVYFQEYPQAWLALKQGRIDAMSTTDLTLSAFAKEDPNFVVIEPPFKPDPWVIGVRQNDSKWRLFLEESIMDAWHDGTIQKLYEKNMGGKINFTLPVWPDYYSK